MGGGPTVNTLVPVQPQMPSAPPVMPHAAPPLGSSPFGGVVPPPPPPPPTERGPRRWPWVVGAIAVVVVLALLGAWLWSRAGDTQATPAPQPSTTTVPVGPSSAPSTSEPSGGSPTTTAPKTTVPVTPLPEDPKLTKAVDDSIAFIETTRGVTFKERPKVEVLDDAAFRQTVSQEFESETDALRSEGRLLTALGLVEPDTDVVAAERELLGAGVLGFYDPVTKRLVVRAGGVTPLARVVITHELTHALDDQLYNLNRPDLDKATDETGFAFHMLAEGSAKYVENLFRATLSTSEQADAAREETRMGMDQIQSLATVPPILLTLLQAPYPLGESLITEIVKQGGVAAIGQAYSKLPTTSEQGFEPAKYTAGEGAAAVSAPPADGTTELDGALGTLVLDAMVSDEFDQLTELATGPVLDAGVDGWSGDHFVMWDQGGAPCVRADVKMDNATELQGLQAGVKKWSDRVGGAQVQVQGADTLRITRCASAAAGGNSPA